MFEVLTYSSTFRSLYIFFHKIWGTPVPEFNVDIGIATLSTSMPDTFDLNVSHGFLSFVPILLDRETLSLGIVSWSHSKSQRPLKFILLIWFQGRIYHLSWWLYNPTQISLPPFCHLPCSEYTWHNYCFWYNFNWTFSCHSLSFPWAPDLSASRHILLLAAKGRFKEKKKKLMEFSIKLAGWVLDAPFFH